MTVLGHRKYQYLFCRENSGEDNLRARMPIIIFSCKSTSRKIALVPLKTYKNVLKTTKTTATKKKNRRRHNDDIHDEDVVNRQPSPHPIPTIILPKAFLHAPNMFKPVSHSGSRNNTSSTVLNFKNVVSSMRSCPKTQALSLKVFFYNYVSVHCPKTQALSL